MTERLVTLPRCVRFHCGSGGACGCFACVRAYVLFDNVVPCAYLVWLFVFSPQTDGYTALMIAGEIGAVDATSALFNRGAVIDATKVCFCDRLLCAAALEGLACQHVCCRLSNRLTDERLCNWLAERVN